VYAVLLEAGAERDLDRLDPPAFNRVIKRIRELGADPRPAGCRKLYGGSSEWRVRVGDYRVIYEVDDRGREVRVLRVRHRRDAYR
jgi:mRNA interferase RelE/StbE